MQYGLALPSGREAGDPRFLLELVERAEAAGWDGVFLRGLRLLPGRSGGATTDTFAVLAAAAARTSRVKLGIEVTPLTRRRPWIVVRQAAAVDQLSEGRMILGVGPGDTGESTVADASFSRSRRGGRPATARRDARLAAGDPRGALDGRALLVPRPPLRDRRGHAPSPPRAGAADPDLDRRRYPSRRPVERGLRWDARASKAPRGDMTPDDVRDLRRRAGDRAWAVAVGGSPRRDDREQEREHVRGVRDAGATWWIEWIPTGERDAMRAAADVGHSEPDGLRRRASASCRKRP